VTTASRDLYLDGVRVEVYGEPANSAPLLFVHGGSQGSWAWERIAPRLAEDGFYAVSELVRPQWFGSAIVAESLHCPPVLIAHSMGSIPSLAYAAANEVNGMVLLGPVLPAGLGAEVLDGEGHGLIVNPVWTEVAARIGEWLSHASPSTVPRQEAHRPPPR